MKIKDIDIHKIENLLNSIPDEVECECIYFTENAYNLRLIASTKQAEEVEQTTTLKDLTELINNLEQKRLEENV